MAEAAARRQQALRRREAVSDVTMVVADGGFMVLLGPTGAGKTTTLRLIAGLEAPMGAASKSAGATSAATRRRSATWRWCSSSIRSIRTDRARNLAFPLRSPLRPLPLAEIDRTVYAVAAMLRISSKWTPRRRSSRAAKCSGSRSDGHWCAAGDVPDGRAALLARRRAARRTPCRAEAHPGELGATIIYVTHDQIEAMTMATHSAC